MALRRLGECCRSLLYESSKQVFSRVLVPAGFDRCLGAKRYLLSEDVVKLQEFQQKKLALAHLAVGSEGGFIDSFNRKLQRNEMIMEDELKLLLHLCQSSDDMLVAKDAIYRFHSDNRNLMQGRFRFGPLFMRLCYELGLESMAAATLTDESMKGFFNDSTSFNIAIDMLFLKESFDTALEVLKFMRNQKILFNKDTMTLATATCYKLNTAESYRFCTTLIEKRLSKGYFFPRHAFCFAVALALRQNDLQNAQTVFSQIMNTDSGLCQNIKVVLLVMSGAIREALSVLSAALLVKSPYFVRRVEFSQEVVDLLRLRSERKPILKNVEQIVTKLEQCGQVTQQTVDDMLCRTPTGKRKEEPIIAEQRKRPWTLKPLNSTLISE